jgi:hypothetical protein
MNTFFKRDQLLEEAKGPVQFVVCPKCKHKVAKDESCIFCGHKLNQVKPKDALDDRVFEITKR